MQSIWVANPTKDFINKVQQALALSSPSREIRKMSGKVFRETFINAVLYNDGLLFQCTIPTSWHHYLAV